jgi:hypothetical protein
MRRTSTLTVVGVVTMSAAIASAAQASPEYFTCVKKSGGNYSAKTCAPASKVPGTGKFERESAIGVTFSAKSKAVTLAVPSVGSITCKKSHDTGMITGASTDEEQTTAEQCRTAEGAICSSAGQAAGIIKSNPQQTELVGSEAEPEVRYTALSGGTGGFQYETTCGLALLRVKGFSDGKITSPASNTASKKTLISFGPESNLLTEVNTGSGFFGPFASGLSGQLKGKYSATVGVT